MMISYPERLRIRWRVFPSDKSRALFELGCDVCIPEVRLLRSRGCAGLAVGAEMRVVPERKDDVGLRVRYEAGEVDYGTYRGL